MNLGREDIFAELLEYQNGEKRLMRSTHDHGGEVTPKVRCERQGQLPSNEPEISAWIVGLFWPSGFEGTIAILNQTDDRF
jgi:hypothetical protein